MPFDHKFLFGGNDHIVIETVNGKHLRVNPKNENTADPHGAKGGYAQWHAEKAGNHWRFKNHHSGKYLRIKNKHEIDVAGGTGPFTLFEVKGSGHERMLESHKFPGHYIAVRDNKVVMGSGGPFCKLKFHSNKAPVSSHKPYLFAINNHIVIECPNGKHLRVNPNNENTPDPHGAKGGYAQWHTEKDGKHWRFKNHHSGKYLRIKNKHEIDVAGGTGPFTLFDVHGSGHERKLESHKFPGHYIAVRDNKVVMGTGGPFCKLKFHRV